MNKKMLVSLVVGAATGVCFFTGGNDAYASETDGVWTPRTVDQIKADINQAQNNKYIIVWGDTLSGISEATNLTIQKLADMNKIANVDLIYAGNTLVFEGNVVSVENDKGETLVQSVIQDTPADKIDPSKPVGQPATNDNGAGNTNGNEAGNTSGNEAGNTGGNEGGNTNGNEGGNTGGNEGGNTNGNEGGNTGGNEGGNTNGNEGGNTGGNEGGNTNGNEGGNTGGNEGGNTGGNEGGNTGGNEGGNTGGNEGGNTGGETQGKFTVWYTSSDDPSKNIELGTHVFETRAEAQAWIENYSDELLKEGISADNYGVSDWNK
ncbi:LysM domain-containing protein [Enterococcus faecalis]|uniref:LysM peptidoglycan-binding domain-containing protein n=1 Tax=Enterococcus faecalis TaxID=1351 RepID=UPI002A759DEC|nr:LysM domain-containing protein [Enterococcus faecalis]MDY2553563.1 LysM domain-containing protein [Enterococcus faecalis]